jgi:hypothetical protein
MSKVEEIERAIEKLAPTDFVKLAGWIDRRRVEIVRDVPLLRDHTAFLNSYAPEDEGLYDDAAAR